MGVWSKFAQTNLKHCTLDYLIISAFLLFSTLHFFACAVALVVCLNLDRCLLLRRIQKMMKKKERDSYLCKN